MTFMNLCLLLIELCLKTWICRCVCTEKKIDTESTRSRGKERKRMMGGEGKGREGGTERKRVRHIYYIL